MPRQQNQAIVLGPPWLDIAYKELDVHELPGADNNKRILEYHSVTSLGARFDSVPWCAAFVSWCLEQCEIKSTRSAAAASYLNWGYAIKDPMYGCICVLKRDGGNHVGFFIREAGEFVELLGGNQNNKVGFKLYPKARILSYRYINF